MRRILFLSIALVFCASPLFAEDDDSVLVIMQPVICAGEGDAASSAMVGQMSITLMSDSAVAEYLFLPSAGTTYVDAITSPVSSVAKTKITLNGRILWLSVESEALPTTTIYTLKGQTVDSFKALRRDLSSLPAGEYILYMRMSGSKAEAYKLKVK